jgi:nucleoid-associated protein YgaU
VADLGVASEAIPNASASRELQAEAGSAVAGISANATADAETVDVQDVTIRAAEAEAGNLYVAGEAPANSLVSIYADEMLVGETTADAKGMWLLEAEAELAAGEVVFRAEAASDQGGPVFAEVEAPFMRLAEGVLLEPIAASASGGADDVAATGEIAPPTYILIRRGDNLWRIARRNYGRGIKYHAIFEANSEHIRNPHRIYPGQVFVVPTRDRRWEAAVN